MRNVQSGRVALRFLLSEAVEFNLIGDLTSQRQEGPADKYTVIDPNGGFFTAGWNAQVAAPIFGAGVGYDQRFLTNSPFTNYSRFGDPLTNRYFPNINDLQHWGVSGTLEWRLSETLALKSVTGYRRFWNRFGRDSDGSPLPVDGTYDDNRHRQLTEELQLTGTAGALDYAVGGFYYDARDTNQGYNYLYNAVHRLAGLARPPGHDELGAVRAGHVPRHRPALVHGGPALHGRIRRTPRSIARSSAAWSTYRTSSCPRPPPTRTTRCPPTIAGRPRS